MNYEKTLEFIHSLNRFGIKPGLQRISALANLLGNPQNSLQFIHVAGTNGKGSTSTMLSNIMVESGKKTGLFISPFVVDFRERIQINGNFIEKEELCCLVEKVKAAADKVLNDLDDAVTEFEFITMVAFLYFAEKKCDIVVLETGLGGRLDSTNIIENPLASVITKIDLDHTAVLGNSIEKITEEKCGIIKKNSLVVTPSTQNPKALRIISKTAQDKNSHFILADRDFAEQIRSETFGTYVTYKDIELFSHLSGIHQVENITLAVQTAISLGLDENAIKKGIEKTFFPARLEVISKNPLVILDGAHNNNGADALCEYIDSHNLKPVILFGMMRDKDCESVASKLSKRASFVITVTVAANPRAESRENLAKMCQKNCAGVTAIDSYCAAIDFADKKAKELSSPLLICGSLYLASDIRPSLLEKYNK